MKRKAAASPWKESIAHLNQTGIVLAPRVTTKFKWQLLLSLWVNFCGPSESSSAGISEGSVQLVFGKGHKDQQDKSSSAVPEEQGYCCSDHSLNFCFISVLLILRTKKGILKRFSAVTLKMACILQAAFFSGVSSVSLWSQANRGQRLGAKTCAYVPLSNSPYHSLTGLF